MNYYEQIMKVISSKNIPLHVRNDVLNRCFDWFSSGGNEYDNYIKSQYEYLLRVKKRYSC